MKATAMKAMEIYGGRAGNAYGSRGRSRIPQDYRMESYRSALKQDSRESIIDSEVYSDCSQTYNETYTVICEETCAATCAATCADLVCPSCQNIYVIDPNILPPDMQVRCFVCKCVWLPMRNIDLVNNQTSAELILSTEGNDQSNSKSSIWKTIIFLGSLLILGFGLLMMNEDSGIFTPIQKEIIVKNDNQSSDTSYLSVKILNTDTSGRELKRVILNFPHGQEIVYVNTYIRPGSVYNLKYPLADRYAQTKIIPEIDIV